MPWHELKQTKYGKTVRRLIPDKISTFKDTFNKDLMLNNQDFWKHISKIINVPYEDLSLDNYMCAYFADDGYRKVTVCRPNHDVAHAIRKLLYCNLLITLLAQTEDSHAQSCLGHLATFEDINLLHLLMFLERAGRTNELPSSSDSTITERTEQIFYIVATEQLQCDKGLVLMFCDVLTGKKRSSDNSERIRQKINFLHHVLITSHHVDLLRCRRTSDVEGWLQSDIQMLLPNSSRHTVKEIARALISFAQAAFSHTGTCYDAETGNILQDDSTKKVACVLNPGGTIQQLLEVSISYSRTPEGGTASEHPSTTVVVPNGEPSLTTTEVSMQSPRC